MISQSPAITRQLTDSHAQAAQRSAHARDAMRLWVPLDRDVDRFASVLFSRVELRSGHRRQIVGGTPRPPNTSAPRVEVAIIGPELRSSHMCFWLFGDELDVPHRAVEAALAGLVRPVGVVVAGRREWHWRTLRSSETTSRLYVVARGGERVERPTIFEATEIAALDRSLRWLERRAPLHTSRREERRRRRTTT